MKNQNCFKMLLVSIAILVTSALMAQTTSPVTVNIFDSEGNSITGTFKVFKTWGFVGEYPTGTTVNLIEGTNYELFAVYNSTTTNKEYFTADAAGHTYEFHTTNVKFHWDGWNCDYRVSGWVSFGKTNGEWNAKELFPNDYQGNMMRINFRHPANGIMTDITVDYDGLYTFEKVASQLRLLASDGAPLYGGKARVGYVTPTTWFVPGETNVYGLLMDLRNGSNPNLAYEMGYNHTTKWILPQEGSYYEFQTQLLTLRMEDCDHNPIDGGSPAFGSGASTGTWYFPGGATGSSAPGESTAEMFDGTFSFRMQYKATTEYKMGFSFPANGSTITWQTTNVTLIYDGAISYGGATGDATYFTKPSMDLLHGTYTFHFRYDGRIDLDFTGCDFVYEPVFNQPPIAICQDVIVDADGNCEAMVSVEDVNNGSYDPDGDPILLELTPEGPYPLGTTEVTLTVTDDSEEFDECTATITVADNTPPVITAISDPISLWPPNHKYKEFEIADFVTSVSDNCSNIDINDIIITYATSDEPENANGGGDGNTTDDIMISDDCKSLKLRKERKGNGNGRVYTIHLEVDDESGNPAIASCQIHVPHNNGGTAIDDGPDYTVSGDCGLKSGILAENLEPTSDSGNTLMSYPNPFTGVTYISFSLSEQSNVTLKVYNSMGQEVNTLVNGILHGGSQKVCWDGNDHSGNVVDKGVYIYQLIEGDKIFRKKVIKQ